MTSVSAGHIILTPTLEAKQYSDFFDDLIEISQLQYHFIPFLYKAEAGLRQTRQGWQDELSNFTAVKMARLELIFKISRGF